MSFWVKNFGVSKVGWRVMHDGIPGLSGPEDFRAAEFDMEKKMLIFLDLRCTPLPSTLLFSFISIVLAVTRDMQNGKNNLFHSFHISTWSYRHQYNTPASYCFSISLTFALE